jgi:hypothetical protein
MTVAILDWLRAEEQRLAEQVATLERIIAESATKGPADRFEADHLAKVLRVKRDELERRLSAVQTLLRPKSFAITIEIDGKQETFQ